MHRILIAAILGCLLAAPSRADFSLSLVPEGPLTPGGTVTVDVFANVAGSVPLSFYDLTLIVTTGPVAPEFVVPGSADALVNRPNYVFYQDSASAPTNPGTVTSSLTASPRSWASTPAHSSPSPC